LNIDDYEPSRYALTRVMKEAGLETIDAASAEEGIRLAREVRPDLILLDIMLPDLNGLDVARLLKTDHEVAHIPILAVSASYHASESEIRESQADGYILRPVPDSVLIACIWALLAEKEGPEGLTAEGERWHDFVESLAQPVCLLDLEGAILRWNQRFADLVAGSLREQAGLGEDPAPLTLQEETYRLLQEMKAEQRTFDTVLLVAGRHWRLFFLPVWDVEHVLLGVAILARPD
jgi:DNA-binding response OmpR family regulator